MVMLHHDVSGGALRDPEKSATIIRGSTEPLIGRFFPHVIRCERKKLPFDDFH